MKLCAANDHYKLEQAGERYFVRYTGGPWHRKLVEYSTCMLNGVLAFLPLSPLLVIGLMEYKIEKEFFNSVMILFLVFAAFGAWVVTSLNKEFLFTVGIFNFRRRILTTSFNDWIHYEWMEFDIEMHKHSYVLLAQVWGKQMGKTETVVQLRLWQSDSREEIEEMHKLFRTEYACGIATANEYDAWRKNRPWRKLSGRYGCFITAGVFTWIGFASAESRMPMLLVYTPLLLGCNAYCHLRQKWHVDLLIMAVAAVALTEYSIYYLTHTLMGGVQGLPIKPVMVFYRCLEVWYLVPTAWFGFKKARDLFASSGKHE